MKNSKGAISHPKGKSVIIKPIGPIGPKYEIYDPQSVVYPVINDIQGAMLRKLKKIRKQRGDRYKNITYKYRSIPIPRLIEEDANSNKQAEVIDLAKMEALMTGPAEVGKLE